ncbi:hypothetical protein LTR84_009542 [Exophiala bonariae]|uniref:F-box domain-containing protein n=1 Tax=Exophiala bonariae TaxID=1690606 RepID=A0AAV9MUU2_9EURO|nr:hypothetical protein LTR84_009542 [Exophiala bonariae]
MTQTSPSTPELLLTHLPPELLHTILTHLDLPDLLQTSRTCHLLRHLALDPFLHSTRLHTASLTLSHLLSHRASKSSISPPTSWIWMSRTNVLSRQISKSLIRIRLAHNLEHRPTSAELVERAILPRVCGASYDSPVAPGIIQTHQAVQRRSVRDRLARKLKRRPSVRSLVDLNIIPAECVSRTSTSTPGSTSTSGCGECCTVIVSPGLVATRRNVIRELLKDGLRAWVSGRGIQAQKRKADELEATERATVKNLVRRFAARKRAADAECDVVRRWQQQQQQKGRRSHGYGYGYGTLWGREAEIARQRDEERRARMVGDCASEGGQDQDCSTRKAGVDYWGVCAQPTRAHVLGLKTFWEGVIRASAPD